MRNINVSKNKTSPIFTLSIMFLYEEWLSLQKKKTGFSQELLHSQSLCSIKLSSLDHFGMAEWWNGGTAETTSLGCQQVCTTVHEKRVSSRVPSEGSMEHFPNRFSMRQIAFPRRGSCGRHARGKLQRRKPKQRGM